jgi:broad specificity phosphatase PhoE
MAGLHSAKLAKLSHSIAKSHASHPPPMPKLSVIRHGATDMNDAQQIRGWSDTPLNAGGKQQAQQIAAHLANLPDPPTRIVTSDLGRAQETAGAITQALGLPPAQPTMGLRPWNVGQMTGMPHDSALPLMAEFVKNPDLPTPGGESFNDFKNRFLGTIATILSQTGPQDHVGVVTHNRGERVLAAYLAGLNDPNHIDPAEMVGKGTDPGTLSTYHVAPNDPRLPAAPQPPPVPLQK